MEFSSARRIVEGLCPTVLREQIRRADRHREDVRAHVLRLAVANPATKARKHKKILGFADYLGLSYATEDQANEDNLARTAV
jgi:hypothetical protein